MAWLPDHIWLAQKAKKGGSKGVSKGKGKRRGLGRLPDHILLAQMLAKGGSKGFGKRRGFGKGKDKGPRKFVNARPAKASVKDSKYMDKLAKIDSSRKVWVGGLDASTTWKQLEKHFSEVAKPSVTEIMRKGKACLAFKTEEEAQSAISSLNGSELGGKTVEVDVWTQREKPEKVEGEKKQRKKNKKGGKTKMVLNTAFAKNAAKKGKKSGRGDPNAKERLAKVDGSLKVWVGGLEPETHAGKLRKHFADAGCKPKEYNLTGKDSACLSFKTVEEATNAISTVNGTTLDGQVLEVDVWTKREKKDKA